jgi:hypothetical protein
MEYSVRRMKEQFNKYVDDLKVGAVTIDQFRNTLNNNFDTLLEEIEDEALDRRAGAEYMDWVNSKD